ncbi:MAG: hypothetical protein PVG83_03480 [Acidimicrobiia bacterium]
MANLIGVVQSGFFLWGVALGAVGLVLSLLMARARPEVEPLAMGGVVIAVAAVAAVAWAGGSSAPMWAGLMLILLGTVLAVRLGFSRAVVAVASVPGAIVLALAASPDPGWVRVVVIVGTPLLGYATDDFESRYADRGFGIVFFGLAAMGAFLAVPDTEWIRSLFAVCLPMSLTAWPRPRLSLGPSGIYLAMAVFLLFTAAGGIGRPASVIGGLACLGYLVLEPVAVRARPTLARLPGVMHTTPEASLLAAVPQFMLVVIASRVAARTDNPGRAAAIALIAAVAAYLLLVWADSSRVVNPAETHSDV